MGLDMYLYKKTFIWGDERSSMKITGLKKKIDPSKVTYIVEEAGYWRKANAIHQWFVENVQGGEDNCAPYYVSEEQMRELLATVDKVLAASKLVKGKIANGQTMRDGKWVPIMEDGEYIEDTAVAKELLPTQSGFFFGGTEYDQYYHQDLMETKKILDAALADADGHSYEYQSSW